MRTDEAHRHSCEVRDCIRRFYPDGEAMKAHLEKIKRRRGEEAAKRLADDVRVEWRKGR